MWWRDVIGGDKAPNGNECVSTDPSPQRPQIGYLAGNGLEARQMPMTKGRSLGAV